jgi:hypothetical protein
MNQGKTPKRQRRIKIDHYIVTCKGKPCGINGKVLCTNAIPAMIFSANRPVRARQKADKFINRTLWFCMELRQSVMFDWPYMADVMQAGPNDFKLVPVRSGAPELAIKE